MNKEPSPTPDRPDHNTPRLAFVVLALSFLLMALARGTSETFTVFLLPISNAFGWDRAQTVSVYSVSALCVGLAGPFVGRLFDHSGRAPSTRSASSCLAQDFPSRRLRRSY